MSAISTLAAQQQAMLRSLWTPSFAQGARHLAPLVQRGTDFERGLHAYRTNGRELAVRALAAAYPVTQQRLGEDNFAGLARQLWLCEPPSRGDIAQWGQALPARMEGIPELVGDEPDLPDLARVEWLLHRCATAPDAVQDAGSLALLQERAPEHLRLRLAPGSALVPSPWPVVSRLLGHDNHDGPQTALVWREGLRPRVREALPAEACFIAALLQNKSLAEALEATPGLDFSQWLASAWGTRLLLGAAPAESPGDMP